MSAFIFHVLFLLCLDVMFGISLCGKGYEHTSLNLNMLHKKKKIFKAHTPHPHLPLSTIIFSVNVYVTVQQEPKYKNKNENLLISRTYISNTTRTNHITTKCAIYRVCIILAKKSCLQVRCLKIRKLTITPLNAHTHTHFLNIYLTYKKKSQGFVIRIHCTYFFFFL